MAGAARTKQLIDSLQGDLHVLCTEAKRNCERLKQAGERSLLRLRTIAAMAEQSSPDDVIAAIRDADDILPTFLIGSEELKQPRIVQLSMACILRLIENNAVGTNAVAALVATLVRLEANGHDDLKILQCILALVSNNAGLQGELLAQVIVVCFRMNVKRDPSTAAIGTATLRQVVGLVFERVDKEDVASPGGMFADAALRRHPKAPGNLRVGAADAFLLFQDMCLLTSGEGPHWLVGVQEMTRTFGLELIETALSVSPDLFFRHPEFSYLLKEKVCALVISLFSPTIKHAGRTAQSLVFPVTLRLMRVMSVLVRNFHPLLATESEIFLSMLVRFTDTDKPFWQRVLAIEVIHELFLQPGLIGSFCHYYDQQSHNTKIFRDLISAVASTVATVHHQAPERLTLVLPGSANRLLDSLEKTEAPTTLSDEFGLNVAFACVLDVVKIVSSVVPSSSDGAALVAPSLRSPDSASGARPSTPTSGTGPFALAASATSGADPVGHVPLPTVVPLLVASSASAPPAATAQALVANRAANGENDADDLELGAIDEANREIEGAGGDVGIGGGRRPGPTEEELALWRTTVESAGPGLQAVLELFLLISVSPKTTEAILKAFTSFTRVCGVLSLDEPRAAFVATVCTASLPENFTLHPETSSKTWALSEKNLQCVHALFKLASCLGSVLGTDWYQIIVTAQQLVTVLNPPHPLTGQSHCQFTGRSKTGPSKSSSKLQLVMPTTETAVLGSMLAQLFENSEYLSDVALQALIAALCQVSDDTISQINANPSVTNALFRHDAYLFPVFKIWEVGLVNLGRIMEFWPAVTAHLIELAGLEHGGLRTAALEVLTRLVHAALAHPRVPPIQDNPGLQQAILSPLRNLSACENGEAHKRQLECVYQVVDSSGPALAHAWPVVLGILSDSLAVTSPPPSLETVRTAFDSLRMVVNDFLPTVPLPCYPQLLEALCEFGKQKVDVNISLTAAGLLWNMSDYIAKQSVAIDAGLAAASRAGGEGADGLSIGGASSVTPRELWMALFQRLASLCTDARPEVRRSANQTLVSTITTHGPRLPNETWSAFFWDVLFPLLENVQVLARTAPAEEAEQDMMVHHSRNSPKKQWAETHVLSLQGLARIFNSFHHKLRTLPDFQRAWVLALLTLKTAATSDQDEVGLAAVKAFLELVRPPATPDDLTSPPGTPTMPSTLVWQAAWQTWLDMATEALPRTPLPKRVFLTSLLESVSPMLLFAHLQAEFSLEDATKMLPLVRGLMNLQHQDNLILSQMTDLQACALQSVMCLAPTDGGRRNMSFLPLVLRELVLYASYACDPPPPPAAAPAPAAKGASKRALLCVALARAALDHAARLFSRYFSAPQVVHENLAETLFTMLQVPLTRRYDGPSVEFWRQCGEVLAVVAQAAVQGPGGESGWHALASLVHTVLAVPAVHPDNLSHADVEADARRDTAVVHLVRDLLTAPPAGAAPPPSPAVALLSDTLEAGSRGMFQPPPPGRALFVAADRRGFARECLDVLMNTPALRAVPGNEAAATALVDDAVALLTAFVQGCGNIEATEAASDAPDARGARLIFAIVTLGAVVSPLRRPLTIRAFPVLVQCIPFATPAMRRPLSDALMLCAPLLNL